MSLMDPNSTIVFSHDNHAVIESTLSSLPNLQHVDCQNAPLVLDQSDTELWLCEMVDVCWQKVSIN